MIIEGKIFPNFTSANAQLNNEHVTWVPPPIVLASAPGVRTLDEAYAVTGTLRLSAPLQLLTGQWFVPRAFNRFTNDFIDTATDLMPTAPFEAVVIPAAAPAAPTIVERPGKAKARDVG